MKYQGAQHGEAYLRPVKRSSGQAVKYNNFIIAHSETGHHHVLESAAQFDIITDTAKDKLFIRLFAPAKLVHQKQAAKHRTLDIEPGLYEIKHKREYNPFEKIIQEVKD